MHVRLWEVEWARIQKSAEEHLRYTKAFSIDVRKSSVASLCRHVAFAFLKRIVKI